MIVGHRRIGQQIFWIGFLASNVRLHFFAEEIRSANRANPENGSTLSVVLAANNLSGIEATARLGSNDAHDAYDSESSQRFDCKLD